MSQRDIQRLEAIYAQQSNNSRKDSKNGPETNAKLVSTDFYRRVEIPPEETSMLQIDSLITTAFVCLILSIFHTN